jgi:uncharacterized protein (TIGR02145 family)
MKNNKLILYLFISGMLFLTGCPEPEKQILVRTGVVSNIQYTSVDVSGTILDVGEGITQYGHCYAQTSNPTISNDKTILTNATIGDYESTLTDLIANMKYYVRAYASRGLEVVYGDEVSFTTARTLTDIDANQYNVVQIGNQIWMKENLKTTKYNDGTNITYVEDGGVWQTLNAPGYCWYDNYSFFYKDVFGGLYNWYTVNTGKLCPIGWHVPTEAEWNTLTVFLGGQDVAGSKLKETGNMYWDLPNTDATNESGFSARGGGQRYYFNGTFYSKMTIGYFWLATEVTASTASGFGLCWNQARLNWNYGDKRNGQSVRCLKN